MVRSRPLLRALAGTALLACGFLAACAPAKPPGDGEVIDTAPKDLGAAQVLRGQVYAGPPSGPLALDLYLPHAPGPRPLVVYAHGGGWESGDRRIDGEVAAAGAAESLAAERLLRDGYAVATVDYRLSGTAQAPAQAEDVAAAVRWLQREAGRWALDPDHVVLWGASAGGQLAAQLGAVTDDPAAPGGGLTGIRAVVDWYGPADLSTTAQHAHPEVGDYARHAVQRYLGCMPVQCPQRAAAASPIRALSGAEPPYLIQHGTRDPLVPIDESLDLAAEIRRLGGHAELHAYDGYGHGFTPGGGVGAVVDAMAEFLARQR